MDYQNNVCFSEDDVEKLNKKAFSLSKSLFLAAHYEPKDYPSEESARCKFWTAITNLYGLFWDCAPFLPPIISNRDGILLSNATTVKTRFYRLRNFVDSFRSIFCHNNSDVFPLTEEKHIAAEEFVAQICHENIAICNLQEKHFVLLLDELTDSAENVIIDIDGALNNLISSPDTARVEKAIDVWIDAIADTYMKNPSYLLNTMAGMYQLYHLNIRSRTSIKSLRSETIRWLVDNCGVTKDEWHKKWLNTTDIRNLLINWPQEWEARNGIATGGCNEAPLPGSDFFRILASDVDKFAIAPSLGYTS